MNRESPAWLRKRILLTGAALLWPAAGWAATPAPPAPSAADAQPQVGAPTTPAADDRLAETDPDAAQNPGDILVTARRREERLQDVPASVTAFNASQLRKLGLRDIADISLQTPGFALQNASRQNEQPFIRGAAVNSVFRQAQNASFFIDGIYVSGIARTISIDDLERVEVVLGPQAVYFGRATFAGAINYVSRKPDLNQWGVEGRISIADYGQADVTAGINLPITNRLSLRVFGQLHSYDGEYRNSLDGRRVGDEYTDGGSASLRWQPADNLDIIGRVQYTHFDDGHSAVVLYDPRTNNNCRPNAAGVFQFYCGRLRDPQGSEIQLNLSSLVNGRGFRTVDQKRYSLVANWTIRDWTVSSLTAYNSEHQQLSSDGDATRFAPQGGLLQSLFDSTFDDTYQELRVASPQSRPIRILVGGSYFRSRRTDNSLLFPITSLSLPRRISNESAFGSVSWDFLPGLNITGEARWQSDRIRVEGNALLQSEFQRVLPRATLTWKPAADKLIYFTYAEGNKPGDFNTAAGTPAANRVIKEELLKNYELGLKTQWLDGRLTANLTGYHIDWTNQGYQDTVFQEDANGNPIFAGGQRRTVVVTVNTGRTEINGLEFDASYRLTPGWTFRVAYSLTDSRFRDFLSRLPITYAGVPQQVAGNQVFNSPHDKVILSTTYETPIGRGVNLLASSDYTWRGKQYTDELNTAYVGELNLWNARIGITTKALEAFVWARNLLDSDVPDFATRSTDFNSNLNSYLFTLRPSRQIGFTLAFHYREPR